MVHRIVIQDIFFFVVMFFVQLLFFERLNP
jgi:hypothetical protein